MHLSRSQALRPQASNHSGPGCIRLNTLWPKGEVRPEFPDSAKCKECNIYTDGWHERWYSFDILFPTGWNCHGGFNPFEKVKASVYNIKVNKYKKPILSAPDMYCIQFLCSIHISSYIIYIFIYLIFIPRFHPSTSPKQPRGSSSPATRRPRPLKSPPDEAMEGSMASGGGMSQRPRDHHGGWFLLLASGGYFLRNVDVRLATSKTLMGHFKV